MNDITVVKMDEILKGNFKEEELKGPWKLPEGGTFFLNAHGPRHSKYGALNFLTPISELMLTTVTTDEATAYGRFRDRYEQYWRNFFDPICIRVGVGDSLKVDTTIMPLIEGTQYKDMRDLTGNGALKVRDGDLHPEALVHIIFHLNPDARLIKEAESNMGQFLQNLGPNAQRPLSWIGDHAALFVDQDPVFKRFLESKEKERFFNTLDNVPAIGIRLGIRNPLAFAALLTALRKTMETTAPNMVQWSNRKYKEKTYVRIAPEPKKQGDMEIYYSTLSDAITVSNREGVIKGVLDRTLSEAKTETKDYPATATLIPGDWLGDHVAAALHRKVFEFLYEVSLENLRQRVLQQSYNNLFILNELKRLYPDKDPVEVYEKLFCTKIVCPGGKGYVFNKEYGIMESIAFGSKGNSGKTEIPSLPISDFDVFRAGLTFEKDGLRARFQAEPSPGSVKK